MLAVATAAADNARSAARVFQQLSVYARMLLTGINAYKFLYSLLPGDAVEDSYTQVIADVPAAAREFIERAEVIQPVIFHGDPDEEKKSPRADDAVTRLSDYRQAFDQMWTNAHDRVRMSNLMPRLGIGAVPPESLLHNPSAHAHHSVDVEEEGYYFQMKEYLSDHPRLFLLMIVIVAGLVSALLMWMNRRKSELEGMKITEVVAVATSTTTVVEVETVKPAVSIPVVDDWHKPPEIVYPVLERGRQGKNYPPGLQVSEDYDPNAKRGDKRFIEPKGEWIGAKHQKRNPTRGDEPPVVTVIDEYEDQRDAKDQQEADNYFAAEEDAQIDAAIDKQEQKYYGADFGDDDVYGPVGSRNNPYDTGFREAPIKHPGQQRRPVPPSKEYMEAVAAAQPMRVKTEKQKDADRLRFLTGLANRNKLKNSKIVGKRSTCKATMCIDEECKLFHMIPVCPYRRRGVDCPHDCPFFHKLKVKGDPVPKPILKRGKVLIERKELEGMYAGKRSDLAVPMETVFPVYKTADFRERFDDTTPNRLGHCQYCAGNYITTDHNVIVNKGESWIPTDNNGALLWVKLKWKRVAFDRSIAKVPITAKFPRVRIADPKVGDEVYILCKKPNLTVSEGQIISVPDDFDDEVRYTCTTEHGDCGAGVWNKNGALLGIHRADLGGTNGFLRVKMDYFNMKLEGPVQAEPEFKGRVRPDLNSQGRG